MKNTIPDGERRFVRLWHGLIPPARYMAASLNNYTSENDTQVKALQMCREWADTDPSTLTNGLFFVGPVGTGKTHLALATIKELFWNHPTAFIPYHEKWDEYKLMLDNEPNWNRNALTVAYINTVVLLQHIRDGIGNKDQPEAATEYIKMTKRADILVMDDIAAERTTDWVQEQLFAIIDFRYTRKMITCFTSNLNVSGLEAKLGDRSMSRILEMTEGVPVVGRDYRRKGA